MRTHLQPPGFRNAPAFVLIVCCGLMACGGGSAAPTGADDVGACAGVSPSIVLAAVNAARAQARQCGSGSMAPAPSVAWNQALADAASRHSADMAVRNFFSHTGSDGSDVGSRAREAGYGWTSVAENIAGGPSTVAQAMNGWLASPGHCANIMGAGFRDVGLACVTQADSRYTRYWTLVLARP